MSRRPIRTNIQTSAEPAAGPDTDLLRDAFSRWASGVALLAIREDDEVVAITVTAFSPLSLEPPLVLVSVGVHAPLLPGLMESGRFTLSILGEEGRRAAILASSWFPPDSLTFAAGSDPILEGSVVAFVCRLDAVHPGGDHRLVIGKVERVEFGPDEPPLIYHNRNYHRIAR